MDFISLSQFEHYTGIDKRSVSKTIKGLIMKNVILRKEVNNKYGKSYAFGIQKRPLEWKVKFRKPLSEIYYPSDGDPTMVEYRQPQVLSDNHPHTKESISKEISFQRNNICSELRKNISFEHHSTKEIDYDCSKRLFKNINPEDIERWKRKYPGIDIKMQLKIMENWICSNPRKDKKPYRLFIDRWLCKAQENLD